MNLEEDDLLLEQLVTVAVATSALLLFDDEDVNIHAVYRGNN